MKKLIFILTTFLSIACQGQIPAIGGFQQIAQTGGDCLPTSVGTDTVKVQSWDFSTFSGRVVVVLYINYGTLRITILDEGDGYSLKGGLISNSNLSTGDTLSTAFGDLILKSDLTISVNPSSGTWHIITFDSSGVLYDVNHGFKIWADLNLTFAENTYVTQLPLALCMLGNDGGTYDREGVASLYPYYPTNARNSGQGGYIDSYLGIYPTNEMFTGKIGTTTKIYFTDGSIMFEPKLNGVASPANWSVTSAGTASGYLWFARTANSSSSTRTWNYTTFGDDLTIIGNYKNNYTAANVPPANNQVITVANLGFQITFSVPGTWTDWDNLGVYYYDHTTNTLYNVSLDNAQTNAGQYVDNGCIPPAN